jgi:hypothetical protein
MDRDALNPAEPGIAPDYSPSGVDLSLIRWMLALTPAERLKTLEDRTNEIDRIREGNGAT